MHCAIICLKEKKEEKKKKKKNIFKIIKPINFMKILCKNKVYIFELNLCSLIRSLTDRLVNWLAGESTTELFPHVVTSPFVARGYH